MVYGLWGLGVIEFRRSSEAAMQAGAKFEQSLADLLIGFRV